MIRGDETYISANAKLFNYCYRKLCAALAAQICVIQSFRRIGGGSSIVYTVHIRMRKHCSNVNK